LLGSLHQHPTKAQSPIRMIDNHHIDMKCAEQRLSAQAADERPTFTLSKLKGEALGV
jgi:hypothetical protein